VRAANTADSSVHSCHESSVINFLLLSAQIVQQSECEKHGGVPGNLVGLVDILDSTTDIAE
jgi:hypothetical protein